jgi:hypothetical protein
MLCKLISPLLSSSLLSSPLLSSPLLSSPLLSSPSPHPVDKLKYFKEIGLWYLPYTPLPVGTATTATATATQVGNSEVPAYCVDTKAMLSYAYQSNRKGLKTKGYAQGQDKEHEQTNSLVQCCQKHKYFKMKNSV